MGRRERVSEQQITTTRNTPTVGRFAAAAAAGCGGGVESHITSGWGLWGGEGGVGQTIITDRGLIHVAHMLGLLWGPMVGRAHTPLSVRLMDFWGIWEAFQV